MQYQPERGDFCYLDFTPHSGTEQGGRRPALVITPQRYNIATGLALVCPVTSHGKGSPWEVPVPRGARVTGFALANQIRAVDWLSRNADFHSKAPPEFVEEVLALLEPLLWQ